MGKKQRHSYVAFYPTDWSSGTYKMPRPVRSAYFDLCCYMWEFAEPVPKVVADMLLDDLPNGDEVIDLLVTLGKLERDESGALSNRKALEEGRKAFEAWKTLRESGKAGAEKRWGKGERPKRGKIGGPLPPPMENEERRPKSPASQDNSDANASGAAAPNLGLNGGSAALPDPAGFADKVDWFFHPAVVSFMCSGGANEKNARAFIGKVRATLGEQFAIKRIREAAEAKVSDPVGWLQAKLPKARANTGVNRRSFDDIDYGEIGNI